MVLLYRQSRTPPTTSFDYVENLLRICRRSPSISFDYVEDQLRLALGKLDTE